MSLPSTPPQALTLPAGTGLPETPPDALAPQTLQGMDPIALARLYGEPMFAMPRDLYIPPDALKVFLEAFEGPLDLLLYLIRKQNFNILDIPMAALTRQYLAYVDDIRASNLELAAEYLLMAAMLIEIKSRMLLPPRKSPDSAEAEDPRAELVRRLLDYEQIKLAAHRLNTLPQLGRDFLPVSVQSQPVQQQVPVQQPQQTQTQPQMQPAASAAKKKSGPMWLIVLPIVSIVFSGVAIVQCCSGGLSIVFGVLSLACGILGLVFKAPCRWLSIVAVVLGGIGLSCGILASTLGFDSFIPNYSYGF